MVSEASVGCGDSLCLADVLDDNLRESWVRVRTDGQQSDRHMCALGKTGLFWGSNSDFTRKYEFCYCLQLSLYGHKYLPPKRKKTNYEFYLPRELSVMLIIAVHIPPDADTKAALSILYSSMNDQRTLHPDALSLGTLTRQM